MSGVFAAKWIKDFKVENGISSGAVDLNRTAGNRSLSNGSVSGSGSDVSGAEESELWSWGAAPRGGRIVDGKLVRDPNSQKALLNLSDNWLAESYTDSETGLPIDVYTDPLTGRTYYSYLNPATGNPFFSYYTYENIQAGRLVYVYKDPDTDEEVQSWSKPDDVIAALASGIKAYTF